MPEKLPRELRLLYDIAKVAADGPARPEHVLAEIAVRVRDEFGFRSVRFADAVGAPEDEPALAEAEELRAAIARGEVVTAPLLVDGCCEGFLVAERRPRQQPLGERELHLLSAIGLMAGVLLRNALQQRELQSALDDLLVVDQLKEEFASVASHELRTPIAIVHGIATTLHFRYDDLDEAQRGELRGALFEQSRRLCDLAEQLLDLSRVDAGRLGVERRAFRPCEAVESLLPRVAPERAGEVEVAIDPAREIVSDRPAFERVVGNLVANALKYGSPPVTVSGREAANGSFRLAVEDRGPGVDPEFAPQLFERFTRAEGARRSTSAGAGLGLAIAQRYAEALGGRLRYERAAPEGGARFVLTLPA